MDNMMRTSVHAYAYAHMYGLYDRRGQTGLAYYRSRCRNGYGYGCTDNMLRTSVHAYAYAHMYGTGMCMCMGMGMRIEDIRVCICI